MSLSSLERPAGYLPWMLLGAMLLLNGCGDNGDEKVTADAEREDGSQMRHDRDTGDSRYRQGAPVYVPVYPQYPPDQYSQGQYPQGQYPPGQYPQGRYPQGQHSSPGYPSAPAAPRHYENGQGGMAPGADGNPWAGNRPQDYTRNNNRPYWSSQPEYGYREPRYARPDYVRPRYRPLEEESRSSTRQESRPVQPAPYNRMEGSSWQPGPYQGAYPGGYPGSYAAPYGGYGYQPGYVPGLPLYGIPGGGWPGY